MPSFSTSRSLWAMLLTLTSAFALSQAFRTITALLAPGLQHDFGISPGALGAFAGLFGLSFGITQLLMGIGMDVYGVRRTLLLTFPLAVMGAAVSAWAPHYGVLMLGQLLIGMGCSPAFLACTMFIARQFPVERFAFVSGIAMGLGGVGLLMTGTPMAWVVEHHGWRAAFVVLCGLCLLSWVAIAWLVHEPTPPSATAPAARPSWAEALRGMAQLLTLPHTWGMLALGMSSYAAFLSLRGLWVGPLLLERHDLQLVQVGHVALVMSVIALFTPAMFGRLDPGPQRRRQWLANLSLVMATGYVLLAVSPLRSSSITLIIAMTVLAGYSLLQYADVRASYPTAMTGRALSLFTMAMFLGAALMQSVTGWVAAWAVRQGWEPYQSVMLCIALWLTVASTAYRCLPASPLLPAQQP